MNMEDNNKKKEQGQFQMGIDPIVAQGTYSNLALITHSSSDVILDFACVLPGMPNLKLRVELLWHQNMQSDFCRHWLLLQFQKVKLK